MEKAGTVQQAARHVGGEYGLLAAAADVAGDWSLVHLATVVAESRRAGGAIAAAWDANDADGVAAAMREYLRAGRDATALVERFQPVNAAPLGDDVGTTIPCPAPAMEVA